MMMLFGDRQPVTLEGNDVQLLADFYRSKAPQQIFDVASNLVDDVLFEAEDLPGMPSQAAHFRRVNRTKAKMHPAEP
ncbi:Hypp5728 [Branchiostoma lanceolatum]|uniref:Hypp5728 protein n=1 Tax=Branchiostoma lanceolatum TaxID=7740 RepID=A0A8J9VRF5_BRALA|nr:Hypp5728 [Branchiostoma lanceolatum]